MYPLMHIKVVEPKEMAYTLLPDINDRSDVSATFRHKLHHLSCEEITNLKKKNANLAEALRIHYIVDHLAEISYKNTGRGFIFQRLDGNDDIVKDIHNIIELFYDQKMASFDRELPKLLSSTVEQSDLEKISIEVSESLGFEKEVFKQTLTRYFSYLNSYANGMELMKFMPFPGDNSHVDFINNVYELVNSSAILAITE